jgi:hypothetical protein
VAISFVGGATATAASGGDPSLPLPGGMQQNDLVIAAYAIGDNDGVDFNMAMVTAGYTEIVDITSPAETFESDLGVFWKLMGASPDLNAVCDGLGGADAAVAAACLVFRGVDTTTPIDTTPGTASNNNDGSPAIPGVDIVTPGAWTIAVAATGHGQAGGVGYTVPSAYLTNVQAVNSDDTSDIGIVLGYNSAPSDPEVIGTWSHSATVGTASYVCASFAIRPAPAAGGRRITRRRTNIWTPRMRAW